MVSLKNRFITSKNLLRLKKCWKKSYGEVTLDMEGFGLISSYSKEEVQEIQDLDKFFKGQSCCLLGIAPKVFNIDFDKHFDSKGVFSFDLFGKTYFPSLYNDKGLITYTWLYLFKFDLPNDINVALKRINDVVLGKVTHEGLKKLNSYRPIGQNT